MKLLENLRRQSISTALAICLILALSASWPSVADSASGFQSWRSLRDEGVVKQSLDYSCGLAALATLLTYHFNDPVAEEELLEQLRAMPALMPGALDWEREGVSFAVLKALATARGYRALGVRVALPALAQLRVPAIAALNVEGEAHFTVLRGQDTATARYQLGDPAWGNVTVPGWQFADYWAEPHSERGRLLLVAP